MRDKERLPFYGYDEAEQTILREVLETAMSTYSAVDEMLKFFGIDENGTSPFSQERAAILRAVGVVARKRSQ